MVSFRLKNYTGMYCNITREKLISLEILFRVSGFIMSEAEKKLPGTIRDHFVEILANISGAKPNNLSILFAVTDFILKQFNACTPFVEDCNKDWIYKSEVQGYQYLNHVLEMSILTENDAQSTMKYHYMCFNVSHIL